MKNSILLAGAAMLAFGGAAMAQETMPATTPDPAAAPAEASAPADATTTDGAATSAAPTAATTPAPAQTAAATTPAADPARVQAVQQTVQSGWATYDKDNKGALTPLEFGKWVMAAQGQDMSAQVDRTRQSRAANLPAVKVLNATAAAFSKADANHDRAIQPDELTTFLAG